jgi:hypothetical protein
MLGEQRQECQTMNEGPIHLFVRPTQLHAINLASYVGDLSVWLARSYRRSEFDANGAVAAGMIFRRFDDDAPIHLIRQRGHDPHVFCEVFNAHASIVLGYRCINPQVAAQSGILSRAAKDALLDD